MRSSLAEQAATWMRDYPHAFRLFERFALELSRTGKRFGIKLISERVRWECAFDHRESFKVNNNYSAYIARRLIELHPHLEHHLELRETK